MKNIYSYVSPSVIPLAATPLLPSLFLLGEPILIPCPFKHLTGMDCPGCGFQRSAISLFEGDLAESFALYPATIPILVLLIALLVNARWKVDKDGKVIKAFTIVAVVFVIVSYGYKLCTGAVFL